MARLDSIRPEPPQEVVGLLASGGGDHLVPECVQEPHGKRSGAPRRPRHHDLSFPRPHVVVFKRHHREHGRKTRRADHHGPFRRESIRERDQFSTGHLRLLTVAAPVHLAELPPGPDDQIALVVRAVSTVEDASHQIDAGHDRVLSTNHRSTSRHREPVFVV